MMSLDQLPMVSAMTDDVSLNEKGVFHCFAGVLCIVTLIFLAVFASQFDTLQPQEVLSFLPQFVAIYALFLLIWGLLLNASLWLCRHLSQRV